jgi:hypothetical protein
MLYAPCSMLFHNGLLTTNIFGLDHAEKVNTHTKNDQN